MSAHNKQSPVLFAALASVFQAEWLWVVLAHNLQPTPIPLCQITIDHGVPIEALTTEAMPKVRKIRALKRGILGLYNTCYIAGFGCTHSS